MVLKRALHLLVFAFNHCQLNHNRHCKRLKVDHDYRKIRLVSDNPDCEDIEIHEDAHLHTFGEVLNWTEN
ncbi:MAG: S24 family peptidase [Oscillospiraceae bacterium]|nr:S24 family peptidase [Oscillospiraceae bacterium]